MTSAPNHRELFRSWLMLAANACIAVVAIQAVAVFVGWSLDFELLKSLLHPARVAMNPATALSFLLLAAALWLRRRETAPLPQLRLARVLAGLVVVIALSRLIGYLGAWNIGIDQLMFRTRLAGNAMAPNTAVALALLGVALTIFDWTMGKERFHPAQPLVIGAACIALFSITGYLLSAIELYGVQKFIPMALNTAIALALLCATMMLLRPDRQPIVIAVSDTLGGTVARRLIPPAFILPPLLEWLRLYGAGHGYFGAETGQSMVALGNVVIFNLLIWWCASVLRSSHLRHRDAEDALQSSEERFRAITEQSADGIYLVDLDTKRILECNAALVELLRYPAGQCPQTVFDLVSDSREHVEQRLQRLINANAAMYGEREYRCFDGSPIQVESSASVIAYGGRRVACTVVHDITDRKRAERELQEKHRELEEALNQLKLAQSQLVQSEKLASLGQMVAGVAHEINNPLAFVSNNVAVIERDSAAIGDLLKLYAEGDRTIQSHQAELAQRIAALAERIDLAYTTSNMKDLVARSREGLRRIQQIVKDLRDFARLDRSDLQDADLNAGVESTLNIIAGVARTKHVTLEKELVQLPPVNCQPAKINQVVMNLLSNAIDACPAGGKVRVRTTSSDGTVKILVSDNGSGIDPTIIERIFDPFFTTKPPGAGTGLGLSISYGIVQEHGGRITVDSEPGKGATFTVELPLNR